MSFFNDALIEALSSGNYICQECGGRMEFEDEWEDVLICPNCGYSVELDDYGFETQEERDALYPTKEEVCGYEEEEEEFQGETYDEECGELSDD